MDELIFPQPSPAPLILPRRLSTHGGGGPNSKNDRSRKHYFPQQQKQQQQPQQQQQQPSVDENGLITAEQQPQARDNLSLGGNNLTHCFYYPTGLYPPHTTAARSLSPGDGGGSNPPAIFSFGSDRGQDGFVNPSGSEVSAESSVPYCQSATTSSIRRHSVSTGSPWATIPPRHALHMPVMKINPEIWRSENHQREIHRLMREGREEEVMKRRGIQSVMDTISDEDEEEKDMPGVVLTTDLGGFRAAEVREKERIQEEVRQEWARQVDLQNMQWRRSEEFQRRRSWPNILDQQPPIIFSSSGTIGQVHHPHRLENSGGSSSNNNSHNSNNGVSMQRIPHQLPAPGLQRRSSFGPLPSSSSAPGWGQSSRFTTAPGSGQFTHYRG